MKIREVKFKIGECEVELKGETEVDDTLNSFDAMSHSAYNYVVMMTKKYMDISKEFKEESVESEEAEDENSSIKTKESQITAKIDSTNMFV